jgi:hypothetical protein
MSNTDIIGWGSVGLFAIGFYLLYRFITSAPKVLDKLLKYASVPGLQKVGRDSQEKKRLELFLNQYKMSNKTKTKLGSVYKIGRFQGYFCEAVDIQKYRASGGKRKARHDHKLKFVIMEKTGLPDAFTVRLRPEINMTFKFAMSMSKMMGINLDEYKQGLSEEFKRKYIVNIGSRKTGDKLVPENLQKLLVQYGESSHSEIVNFLKNSSGMIFTPDGIIVNLSETNNPKNAKQIMAIVDFGESLMECLMQKEEGCLT